jgi:CheY-like chemotaxis protein
MATVLIVDDSVDNRDLARTVLQYEGHVVLVAGSAHEALRVIATEHPDLVLADLMMPDMNGLDLARALRAKQATSHLPIVFYTAYYTRYGLSYLAAQVGVERVVPKTGDTAVLVAAVTAELRDAG